MNLFLIGYRGTGKSTVAQCLAERLGWPWLDADQVLEETAGCTIQQIFATQGEGAFRDLETRVLAELAARDHHVIALGGGVILREENRRQLAAQGRTIWLQATAETIYARLNTDPTTAQRRPNLTVKGGYAEITELLARREPLYRQCANFTVDTEEKSPDQIALEIIAGLELA